MTMVLGHPGSTQRQLTIAQLDRYLDLDLIPRLLLGSETRGVLNQYASENAEAARTSEDDRFGVENSLKALKGQLGALLHPAVFNFKRGQETELRDFINANPARKKKYGKAWHEIAQAQLAYATFETPYKFIERGNGFSSEYFRFARALVRGAAERGKPNGDRLREYTVSALPTLTQRLFSDAPVYPSLEKVTLAFFADQAT